MATPPRSSAVVIVIAAVVLAVLHHDVWFWADTTLVFGFLPVGLLYHGLFSLAAGGLWWLAVKYAWPAHIEQWADEFEQTEPGDHPAAPGPTVKPREGGRP